MITGFLTALSAAGIVVGKGGPTKNASTANEPSSDDALPATEEQWRERLDPMAYHVLREAGTERPYTGVYWDATDEGTYRCKGCGADLFDSSTKYDAGCGWPSFTQPIEDGRVIEVEDRSRGMIRTEIRCAKCDGHLGHVFPDGPGERGTRYCMNSAALNFESEGETKQESAAPMVEHGVGNAPAVPDGYASAVFGGGCFWCMVAPFQNLDGVTEVLSGFTGGHVQNPSYRQVARGGSGHTEVVRVVYDPKKVDYKDLVEAYWRAIDPTDADGQFGDRGEAYHPAIYVQSEEERRIAEISKQNLQESGQFDAPIVVPIKNAEAFWVAEEEHQDFYKKKPEYYQRYREGSGRGPFLERVWRRDEDSTL